jgi:hypothetical protein
MYISILIFKLLRYTYSRYRGIKKYAKIISIYLFLLYSSLPT